MKLTWSTFKKLVDDKIKKEGYDNNTEIGFIDLTPYQDGGVDIHVDDYGLEIITYSEE